MAKQTFTTGQRLLTTQITALQGNDYNWTVTTGTASYTLQATDVGQRRVQNMAGAGTVTVPNSTFSAGDALWIHSIGSGTQTIVAGSGLTLNSSAGTAPTLAQWEGGVVYFTSASAAIFFRGGGTNTLSVDYLLVGGGGGGGYGRGTSGGGGGGAGGFRTATDLIAKGNTYTVTVGAGGAVCSDSRMPGKNGTASSFIRSANGGGGGGSNINDVGSGGCVGGSGGGSAINVSGTEGTGISGEGNNGGIGNAASSSGAGGGGGAGGTGSNGTSGAGGNGGNASTNDYTGSTISYSGGGGGGGTTSGGTGGTNAANGGSAAAGGNATANRGGGGGGGASSNLGGSGGSGEVVIRALTSDLAKFTVSTTGSPTTGTSGSYTYYQYTATGTFRID